MTLALVLLAAAAWLLATRWRMARLTALAARSDASREAALSIHRVVGGDLVALLGSPTPRPDAAALAAHHTQLCRGDPEPWLAALPGLADRPLPSAAGPLMSTLLAASDEAAAAGETAAGARELIAASCRSTALDPLGAS